MEQNQLAEDCDTAISHLSVRLQPIVSLAGTRLGFEASLPPNSFVERNDLITQWSDSKTIDSSVNLS